MAKNRRLLLLPAIALVLLAEGCDPSGNGDLESLNSQLKQLLKQAEQKIDGLAPQTKEVTEATSQEVEKLFVFEYKVAELKKEAGTAEIEGALQQLGQDRWECFAADRSDKVLRFYCKRRPKTYLRYIPRLVP